MVHAVCVYLRDNFTLTKARGCNEIDRDELGIAIK